MPIVKTKGIRYIRLWHLNAPKKKKKVFGRYDSLVVLSEKQIDVWRQYHRNIKVIPNFLVEMPDKITDYTQKTVISAGRIDNGDQKGFLRLVEIWKIVQDDKSFADWKLRIVGSGPQKKALEEKIRQLNIADSIEIKPFTSKIEEEYMQSSIYVMTSKFEGFGMVLVESAAYGLPAVAFDINAGPSDIISDGESGFLVSDNDLETFAEKMKTLMRDEELRQRFGIKSKEIVSSRFSKERIVGEWKGLFDGMI
jgi:glycosyltransferase involved in cell wall biosynthesis